MATIGDLVVNLGLNAKPLLSGIGSAQRTLGKLGGTLSRLGGLGGALGGLFAVGSFGMLTTSALASIDATAKMADSLGIATEELTSLQHGAGLSGVSIESLNTALKKAQLLRPGESFAALAEEVASISDPAARAQRAVEIFGRSGQQLLPMLAGGAAGIRAMATDAERLGLTFSRLDASKVEQANDAIARMKASITGLAQQAAIGLAPLLTASARQVERLGVLGSSTFAAWGKDATGAVNLISFGIENIGTAFEYVVARSGLAFIQFSAGLEHFFTATMPSYMNWLGQNWSNLWATMASGSQAILKNLATNIETVFREVWAYIASGGTDAMELSFTPLLDGFKNSLSELPQIAERSISPLERRSSEIVDALGGKLATGLGGAIAETLQDLGGGKLASMIAAPSALALAGGGSGGAAATVPTGGGPQAFQSNTAEAFRGIFSARSAQDTAREQLKIQRQQLKKQDTQISLLQEIARNSGQSAVEIDEIDIGAI